MVLTSKDKELIEDSVAKYLEIVDKEVVSVGVCFNALIALKAEPTATETFSVV